jgi:hypothetical protein
MVEITFGCPNLTPKMATEQQHSKLSTLHNPQFDDSRRTSLTHPMIFNFFSYSQQGKGQDWL